MSGSLELLRDALHNEGGLLAGALRQPASAGDAAAASGGPEFATQAVREGYLLHYSRSRLLETNDRDLELLAGDRCYAIGLADLAARGDLPGIRLLAGIIAGGAKAHGAGDPEAAEALWGTVAEPG